MNAYRIQLDIPKTTLVTNPVSQAIKLEHGTIRLLEIAFPDGCADLVKCRIMDGIRQISPINEGTWWYWNDHVFRYDPNYYLESSPFELQIQGYNQDDLVDKYVVLNFYVDPGKKNKESSLLSQLWNYVPFGRVE